jgi:hypothetical protein
MSFNTEGQEMSKVATPTMGPQTATVKLPHEKIAMRAYEKWCKRGQKHGNHVQDWLEAERELLSEFRLGAMPQRR